MAKHKLNAAKLATIDDVGRYHDGEGLYLQVTKSESSTNRSWVFKYTVPGSGGCIREMGLGSFRDVSLKQARDKADAARKLVKVHKLDPIETEKAARIAERLKKANAATFKEEAEFLIEKKRPGWKSGVHAKQWTATLATYAYPVIGALPVSEINTNHILKVLEPIWETKTETATRLRARIENVLSSAKTRGKRTGDNPAAWKGHLENILAKPKSIKKIRHHPALPYEEMPKFFKELRERDGISARALEFLILNGSRTGEVIFATWAEIDFDEKQWTIPKERMKIIKSKLEQRRDHVVPLSDLLGQILQASREECALIAKLADEGVYVAYRVDTDPAAILGVVTTSRQTRAAA